MRSKVFSWMACSIMFRACWVGAAPNAAPKTPLTKQQATQKYSSLSFDEKSERLSPNFMGNDPKQIYETLLVAAKSKEKDEFETTAAYEKRVKEADKKPLFGQLTVQSVFSSAIASGSKYDADKEQLNVLIPIINGPYNASVGSGVAPMAFYASDAEEEKTLPSHKESWTYWFLSDQSKQFEIKNETVSANSPMKGMEINYLQFSLAMSAEDAKLAKPNLRTLIIFKLNPPRITERIKTDEPTSGRSTRLIRHQRYMHTVVKSILVYDGITGKIYARKEPRNIP